MDAAAIEAEVARQMAGRPVAEPIEIEDEDEGRAVALFLSLDTQWNWASGLVMNGIGGMPMRTGIRYEAIAPVAAALDMTFDAPLLRDLQELERTALKAMAESRA